MKARPASCRCARCWLAPVFSPTHPAPVATLQCPVALRPASVQSTLSYLYQLIEARLASYQPLLSLAGRLDVVLAHAQAAAGASADAAARTPADAPLVSRAG